MTAQILTPSQTRTWLCPHCRTPVVVDAHVKDAMLTCPSCGKAFRVEDHQPAQTNAPHLALPPAVESPPSEKSAAQASVSDQPAATPTPAPVLAAGTQAAVAAATRAISLAVTPEAPGELIHLAMFRRYPFR